MAVIAASAAVKQSDNTIRERFFFAMRRILSPTNFQQNSPARPGCQTRIKKS
jgi:hypothetical protein